MSQETVAKERDIRDSSITEIQNGGGERNDMCAASSSVENSHTLISSERKRKMPTFKDILSKADEKIKRKLLPIQSWDTLKINDVYLVKSVHEMPIDFMKGTRVSNYIYVEDKDENLLNIWISGIINNELKKHKIEEENIYIIPLGKKKSKNSHEYNNFIIIEDEK